MKKRIQRYAFHVGHWTLRISRWTLYASAAMLVLLMIVFAVARFLLPMLEERKPDLEQYLSHRSGQVVHIDTLLAYWDGLHPGARANGMQVYATDGRQPAIRLSEVRISLALLPLLWGKLEINSLVVVNPSLALERLADGRFRVSGLNPLQDAQQTDDEKFFVWLFQQGRLKIENGEMRWLDHRATDSRVHLKRVNLSLENRGSRHRLEFSAEFPPRMCRECSLILDISGDPLVSAEWDGDIYLRAAEVDIDALPLIAREHLPPALLGKFNLQMWSEWEQGRPVSVRGSVHVADLRLSLPGWVTPLGIREAGGDLSWKTRRSGWRLDVANPMIGLTGPAWAAEHFRVLYQPDESQVQVKHLDLGDITGFATRLKSELVEAAKTAPEKSGALLDYWLAARPEGSADNFNLRAYKDGDSNDFLLETDINTATVLPFEKYPGVQGLSGHLSVSRYAGNLRLDSDNISVSLPQIFRNPLVAKRVNAELSWEKYDDHWLIKGNNLRVNSDDAQGTGKLSVRVPLDPSVSPYVKLRVDFHDGNGAHAARYYPAERLSPATLAWMERSFLGGEITEGYLIYDGPIRDFPFRQHTGKFELRGHVRRGVYRFLSGWEPVKQAEVDVAVNGPEVLVTGNGKIGNLNANQVVVQTKDSSDGHRVVHVSGNVTGPVNETLNVLREVRPEPGTARWLAYVPAGLQGVGEGALSLDLNIPLGQAHSTTVTGEYRFLKSALRFPGTGVAAEGVEGSVNFTESGIRDGILRSRFLGGETVLTAGQDNGQLRIHGEGVISAQGVSPMLGAQIASRVSGGINWNATWRWSNDTGDLRAEADLRNLKISLPAPLDRPQGLAEEKLVVRTESSTPGNIMLGVSVGNRMSGRLQFGHETGGWSLTRGRIGFGEESVALPKERGLHVSARLDEVDIDQWRPWLGDGPGGIPTLLSRVSAEVRSLSMFDRRLGNVALDFTRNRDDWSGNVSGASMAGNVKFSGKGPAAKFELDLARLVLPDKQHERRDVQVDPRRLPTVELRSKYFQVRDKQLGELDFMAAPSESGWEIKRFNLSRPEMKLNISGNWQFVNNNHASDFVIELNSTDLGKTMEAFGVPDQMVGGEVSVKSHLSWPESPANAQLASLSGGVEVTAKKGRFLQIKQGAGRLFGLLDLSAISRYLTLDFSPVFGKGFIYNQIHGQVSIEKGNAYTHNFSINGPATQIDIGGRIGLAAEDYDLTIELEPKLSDTVTLATWGVWGPQVAAVVLAAQKIFKKQIAAGTRITYVVKGPWDKPEINKLVKVMESKSPATPSKADDESGIR
ncbi:MAG TPA: YhdP family protein [Sulfuricaulis sp.]|nr:YhdP family protein [Sulfuricaulis sp.]